MSLALAVAGGMGLAVGQDAVPQAKDAVPQATDAMPQAKDAVPQAKADDLKKQDTVPPATGKSVPEQAGTQEPSSKAASVKDADVLTNGALTAPGSPADVDTVPAKFSARSTADDQLPIAAYRLRHLTGDQRNEIVQGLGSQRDAAPRSGEANAAYAIVGAAIPSTVALTGLTAMPEALTAKFPGLRGTAFMRAAGKVLVVDLDNSLVVGVLEG